MGDCDFFICLPILFGCPTKLKPDGDQSPRICPRCNNASVTQAKSRMWIEICCVPIIPMNSKQIWFCSICSWEVPLQQGWEPAIPGPGFAPGWQGQARQGWNGPGPGQMSSPQPGYGPLQPGYGPPQAGYGPTHMNSYQR